MSKIDPYVRFIYYSILHVDPQDYDERIMMYKMCKEYGISKGIAIHENSHIPKVWKEMIEYLKIKRAIKDHKRKIKNGL